MGLSFHGKAQHLSFLNIPLGQVTESFEKALKEKGFYFEDNLGSMGISYRGRFWKFDNCTAYLKEDYNRITSVSVIGNGDRALYDKLVDEMDRKYGPHDIRQEIIPKYYTYIWKAKGGEIHSMLQDMGTNYLIHISYYDNTSVILKRDKARDRNTDNDL